MDEATLWLIVGTGIPALIGLLGVVAELTPWTWDNKAIRFVRKIWAVIPLGERVPGNMGRNSRKK